LQYLLNSYFSSHLVVASQDFKNLKINNQQTCCSNINNNFYNNNFYFTFHYGSLLSIVLDFFNFIIYYILISSHLISASQDSKNLEISIENSSKFVVL